VAHICNPATPEAEIRRMVVQDQPWAKIETFSEKIIKAKRAVGVAEVVKHLPGKRKTLSSNSSTTYTQKKKC
jgi:hypothetical protein